MACTEQHFEQCMLIHVVLFGIGEYIDADQCTVLGRRRHTKYHHSTSFDMHMHFNPWSQSIYYRLISPWVTKWDQSIHEIILALFVTPFLFLYPLFIFWESGDIGLSWKTFHLFLIFIVWDSYGSNRSYGVEDLFISDMQGYHEEPCIAKTWGRSAHVLPSL